MIYLIGMSGRPKDFLKFAKCIYSVDNAFLVSLVGLRPEKHFWLGLSNLNDIDAFVWTNSDSVRFTHWNAGMPGTVTFATSTFYLNKINKTSHQIMFDCCFPTTLKAINRAVLP